MVPRILTGLTSFDEILIFVMRTYPEPLNFIFCPGGQSAVTATDPRGPELSDLLEMKRRMGCISKPELEILSGEALDLLWQAFEPATKAFRRRGLYQAESPVGRDSRTEDARKLFVVFRSERLPRSRGPTCDCALRRTIAPVRRTLERRVLQWPFRSRRLNSCIISNPTCAAMASRLKGDVDIPDSKTSTKERNDETTNTYPPDPS